MGLGRDALDRDVLFAQGQPRALDDLLIGRWGITGVERGDLLLKLLESGQPLLGRIDRAGDATLSRRFGRTQGDEQVVEIHHRTPRGHTHDVATSIELPCFAGPRQDNVVLFGIDKDIFDALQPGKEKHVFADRLIAIGKRLDGRFETSQ